MNNQQTINNLPIVLRNEDIGDYYEKDIWKLEDLGLKGSVSERLMTINFKSIHQVWLKDLTKQYLKICSLNSSASKIAQNLSSLKQFSEFLVSTYPHSLETIKIDRKLIENYFHYLKKKELKISTLHIRIVNMSSFLKTCYMRKWIPNLEPFLIFPEDYPKLPKSAPRDIPESVISQLNENAHFLDGHVRRMLFLFQEAGMRISELCGLKFDCLSTDLDGDYKLKYYQYKLKKEHLIPINKETAAIVIEQQEAVKREWGSHELLFPMPAKISFIDGTQRPSRDPGKQWVRITFLYHLNALAKKKKILGPNGTIWHFDSHSFRHSLGTKFINSGVAQHFVQHYLGHESPTMTSIYARIHDDTMKKELAKLPPKLVNILGEALKPEQLIDDVAKGTSLEDIDTRWLKKNILMQTLPNGACALPAISKACPHANACLSCTNFRTDKRYLDQHKKQLEQTMKVVDLARRNNWTRQEEMNTQVMNSLQKIISALEN